MMANVLYPGEMLLAYSMPTLKKEHKSNVLVVKVTLLESNGMIQEKEFKIELEGYELGFYNQINQILEEEFEKYKESKRFEGRVK